MHSTCALSPTPPSIFPSVELEQFFVPFPTVWIEEIDPSATSTPTPPLELASMLVLDEKVKFLSFLVNRVVNSPLDVWINDNNHLSGVNLHKVWIKLGFFYLAGEGLNIVEHVNWIREVLIVPNHVFVVFGILDIEPKHIDGDIRLVEAGLYTSDIFGTDVVPSTLVVG